MQHLNLNLSELGDPCISFLETFYRNCTRFGEINQNDRPEEREKARGEKKEAKRPVKI